MRLNFFRFSPCCYTTHGMSASFCNVALPVPLRNTFTYSIPEVLLPQVQPGCRVLVPFRKKFLVGVVVELVDTPPAETKIRDVAKVLDLVPALTAKLIELAHWIAGYYLAPIGEVFRAMLPPVTELTARRQIVLTETGKALAYDLQQGRLLTDLSGSEAEFLQKVLEKKGVLQFTSYLKLGIQLDALQRLQRRGYVQIQETAQGRKRKVHNVIAWKGGSATAGNAPTEKEERIRALLETERGPLPLPQLLKLAGVSRALIERMLRDGLLEPGKNRLIPPKIPST